MGNGYDYLWKTSVIRFDVVTDLIIILSYFAVSLLLFYFLRQRPDIPFQKLFWLFCALIMICGTTHLFELWTLWHSDYGLSSLLNAIAAGVSLYMTSELARLIPKALAQPNLLEMENESILAQLALRQSEATNRALLEAIPDALLRIHRDGTCLDFIPAKNSQTPISARRLLGKTISEVLPPELAIKVSADVEAAFSTGKVQVSEVPIQIKGNLHHYEIRTVFYSDDDVLTIGRDVTEQKQAEVALRESEEQFRQLTENIHEVFFLTTRDLSKVLYISPAYEEVWGRTAESLYARPKSWLDSVHLEDRDRIVEALTQHLQAGQDFVEEYRVVRPDGSVRWVWVRAFHIFNPVGVPERIAGIAEDITKRKLAQVEILNALAKEKELRDLKSRFISITSHEFRTPLATIMSTAELLEYYEWTKEEEVEQLHLIQDAVRHMLELLDDLLFIGIAEAGKVRFNPEPFLLNEFCQDLVAQIQRGMSLNPTDLSVQHSLIFVFQGDSFLGCMDKKLLRQLLSNLLHNAIKYSPAGGEVIFQLTCESDKAIFEIQDQGIGIPREDQSRLFEFFYRAKNVGAIAGTGLGLAIVKTCVDLHRGKITVNSEVGVGTRFIVSLPLKNHFCVPLLNRSASSYKKVNAN